MLVATPLRRPEASALRAKVELLRLQPCLVRWLLKQRIPAMHAGFATRAVASSILASGGTAVPFDTVRAVCALGGWSRAAAGANTVESVYVQHEAERQIDLAVSRWWAASRRAGGVRGLGHLMVSWASTDRLALCCLPLCLQAVQLGQPVSPERRAAMLAAFQGEDVSPDAPVKDGGRCQLDIAVRRAAFLSPTIIFYQHAFDMLTLELRALASTLIEVPFRR